MLHKNTVIVVTFKPQISIYFVVIFCENRGAQEEVKGHMAFFSLTNKKKSGRCGSPFSTATTFGMGINQLYTQKSGAKGQPNLTDCVSPGLVTGSQQDLGLDFDSVGLLSN